jgi:hypothetical protein
MSKYILCHSGSTSVSSLNDEGGEENEEEEHEGAKFLDHKGEIDVEKVKGLKPSELKKVILEYNFISHLR